MCRSNSTSRSKLLYGPPLRASPAAPDHPVVGEWVKNLLPFLGMSDPRVFASCRSQGYGRQLPRRPSELPHPRGVRLARTVAIYRTKKQDYSEGPQVSRGAGAALFICGEGGVSGAVREG